MRNFDPVGYTRDKWYDPRSIKNRPSTCDKSHSFCNFDYEWGVEGARMKPTNRPINPSLPNVDLPMCSQKVIAVNYDSMTEQALDDWIAQSMNRNLGSLLNPQKKFNIPPAYEEELKIRYRKNKELKNINENETYFTSGNGPRKEKGYLMNQRKKKISVNALCFDYRKLEPHQDIMGTPIKIREMKKTQKRQIRRRNAVILDSDVHYARLLKQMNKQEPATEKKQQQTFLTLPEKEMIYSFNLQSMQRKSCYEDVPSSLIERQYLRIKQPEKDLLTSHRALMNKQEQLHEKYRLQMNDKTNNAIAQIKQMASLPKSDTQPTGLTGFTYKRTSYSIKKSATQPVELVQKDKRTLQSKIIKLLNDMQVQSEQIDVNMARLNIHANEIFLQHPDSKPQTKWILKAQEKIKDGKNLLAMDCYKQAIILQPELFIPVFNIAVLLEKENMLESARMWFNIAFQFQTDAENVLFGISLVALKQLRFIEALTGINQLFHKVEGSGKKPQPVYYYIRALCHKEMGMEREARADYNAIVSEMKPTNYNVLPNFIFSVVYGKIRRIPLQFNCLSYMLFKEAVYLILNEETKRLKDSDQLLMDIADKLVTQNFFRRFSKNLVVKLLRSATYEEKQKGDIIFVSKSSTSIIINGLVTMKSHEKQFIKPEMVSVLSKGGIIGAGSLENSISEKPNNWFTTLSKVQLVTVSREDFMQFWKGQITFEVDFKFNFIKNVDLFKNLPQCTLFKLCQFFERKTFDRGTILFNDCSYRVQMISKPGKGYGLAKQSQKTDARMVNSGNYQSKDRRRTNKGKPKILQIIKKHIFKFNEMKFNRLKYPGLFVVLRGTVELEDDKGFRCNGMIGEREFFGENMVINSDGYHNYGRLVAESDQLEVLLLDFEKLAWFFNEEDKQIMLSNCQKRQPVQTVRFLRSRFSQCQNLKLKYRHSS